MSYKKINRLAIPAILAGIAEPLIALADTAILGHLGTDELAAVGVGSSLFLLQVWALAQTKSAISAITALYYGKKETSKIESFVFQTFIFNLLLGISVAIFSWMAMDWIFEFYNANGEVLSLAKEYYTIRAIGLPIALATFGLFGVFRGFQNTIWTMQISITGGLLNILLDFVFVYGITGYIPSMGIKGAALASVIAQGLMLILCILFLYRKKVIRVLFTFQPNREIRNFLTMFINLFLRTVALNIAYFLGTKYATSYGKEYVAAHTIAMNIWLFSSFFIDGYATAGNAIAGKLLGQRNNVGIGQIGKRIYSLSIGIGSILGAAYLLGYQFIGSFFSTDKQVILLFESIFWMVIISQPLNGLAFGLDGIFKGLGRTRLLRNLLLVATFLGFIPALLVFDFIELKLYAVWIAFLVFMMCRAFPLLWVFNREFHRPTFERKDH